MTLHAAVRHRRWLRTILTATALTAPVAAPVAAWADANPLAGTLVRQAEYWQAHGRPDLARNAWRRVQQIDPGNEAAKKGLASGGNPPAPSAPAPRQAAAPVQASAQTPAPAPSKPAARAAKSAGDPAGEARVAGFSALDAGNLDVADRAFRKALSINRRDPDALGGIGLVAMKRHQFGRARDSLAKASSWGDPAKWREALEASRYFAGLDEARAQMERGQLDAAQKTAEGLTHSGYSQTGSATELLADIYERQGRHAEAAALFTKAGAGNAATAQNLKSRAAHETALEAMGRGDDAAAEAAFQQGLLLDPSDPWVRYDFARFMIARGRQSEGESLVASLASSKEPDGLYAAAMLNADLGRSGMAQGLIDRIAPDQRSDAMRSFAIGLKVDAAITRARALAAGGRAGEAIQSLRQLGGAKGVPAGKQAAIAQALSDFGDNAAAASLVQQAMDGSITDIGGYEAIVRVAAHSGRDDLAQTALTRATELAGSSPDGARALARISAAQAAVTADRLRLAGRYADAFDLLQAAWDKSPDNAELLSALARLYQSGKMPGKAAQTFQIILSHDAHNRDAMVGLMEMAQAAGDRALSTSAEHDLLEAWPDSYEAYVAAARVEAQRGNGGAAKRLLRTARDLYDRAHPEGSGNPFANASPFAAGAEATASANPFRAQQAPAAVKANPFALGNGTHLAAGTAAVVPAAVSAPVSGMPSDPVLSGIERDIQTLAEDKGPSADVHTEFRSRAGETGLSQLSEVKADATISTGLGRGRIHAKAQAVLIDAGRPTGSSLARFGRNGLIEADAIVAQVASALVQAQTQRASGIALSAGYADNLVEVEAGTTPIGMGKTKPVWSASVSPKFSDSASARVWTDRKPVNDSVISYAGTTDPVTGVGWGQVVKTGAGASLSLDHNDNGVYVDGKYYHFDGTNVPANQSVEFNVGGYFKVLRDTTSKMTLGMNVNYQSYDNDQDFFTYGHGGYFSPQNFLAIAVPLNYELKKQSLDIKASFAPGFQTFYQSQVSLFPTDATAQARLDADKAENSDVRNYYDSLSKTGFALQAAGNVSYRITPTTRVGGEVSYNTFGNFNEFRSLISIGQAIGSGH